MKRSKHNLSHTKLFTCEMGRLIPISCVEALPGDTVQHRANVLIRVSPMAAPVMHRMTARVHHFFVPNRIIWDGWEDFITGGPDGMDAQELPKATLPGTPGDLYDYMGVPPLDGLEVCALPIMAYNAIYNEYYRDQDLIPERTSSDSNPARVAWEKDYFTTCRPWPQKGPDVTIPLGNYAPVRGIGVGGTPSSSLPSPILESGGEYATYGTGWSGEDANAGQIYIDADDRSDPGPFPNIYADLANAVGGNVNDIRKAFAIQRYQEVRARYGSRYTEYLRYLGANPRDARLQRPELLGGGQTLINISEIMQTAPDNESNPEFGVGDLYGHGIAAMRSNQYRKTIDEHGWIISLLSVRPKAIYQDGVHRSWLRETKEDFFQKELAYIGQQEVYENEVYADLAAGKNVFGYQDRYAEYREVPSTVAGEFRDVLNYWHMARKFLAAPTLNKSFVECDPTKRIFNEQTTHALWCMAQHKMVARRIVPRNAAPRIL